MGLDRSSKDSANVKGNSAEILVPSPIRDLSSKWAFLAHLIVIFPILEVLDRHAAATAFLRALSTVVIGSSIH